MSEAQLKMKHNGHLIVQCVIDLCSDAGIPGTILSFDLVVTCGFSSHSCDTKK